MTQRRKLIFTTIVGAIAAATAVAIFAVASTQAGSHTAAATAGPRASRIPDDLSPAQARQRDKGEPLVNWNRPFIDGINSPSVAAAESALPFKPALPAAAGTPVAVYIHGDIGAHPEQQALGLVFDSSSSGQFIVTEEPTKSSTAELQQLAATCDPNNGCQGSWTMVTLSDGTPALQIAADVSTGLIWIHNGVRYDVYGPATTFNSAQATQLANAFESSAA